MTSNIEILVNHLKCTVKLTILYIKIKRYNSALKLCLSPVDKNTSREVTHLNN